MVNEKLEFTIKESELFLEELRKKSKNKKYIDISDETWKDAKELIRELFETFQDLYDKELPIPLIIFDLYEGEIAFRWELKHFKLVMNVYDDINEIILYLKKYKEYGKSLVIKRNEIVDIIIKEFYDYLNNFQGLCADIELLASESKNYKVLKTKKDEITIKSTKEYFRAPYIMALIISDLILHNCELKIKIESSKDQITFDLVMESEDIWYKGKIIIVR